MSTDARERAKERLSEMRRLKHARTIFDELIDKFGIYHFRYEFDRFCDYLEKRIKTQDMREDNP